MAVAVRVGGVDVGGEAPSNECLTNSASSRTARCSDPSTIHSWTFAEDY